MLTDTWNTVVLRETVGWHFLCGLLLSAAGKPAWRTRCSQVHPKPLSQKGKLSPQELRMELRRVPTRSPKAGASVRKTEGQRIPWRHAGARHGKIQRVRGVHTAADEYLDLIVFLLAKQGKIKKQLFSICTSYFAFLFSLFFYLTLVACVEIYCILNNLVSKELTMAAEHYLLFCGIKQDH